MRCQRHLAAILLICVAYLCATAAWGQADTQAPQLQPEPAPSPNTFAETAGTNENTPVTPVEDKGAVESFFQLKRSIIDAGKQSDSDNKKSADRARDRHNKSISGTAFESLKHVLDWVGVPLFFVKEDALDPSIDKYSALPPPAFSGDKKSDRSDREGTKTNNPPNDTDASPNKDVIPQKIPESELEGITNDNPSNAVQKN